MAFRKSNAGRYSVHSPTYVSVVVPVPVGMNIPRTVSYAYPSQRQRLRRHIRVGLPRILGRYKLVRVRVRVPERLPLVKASVVAVDARRSRVNIRSKRSVRRVLDDEFNRRRYGERKSRRRSARNGQLDSIRGDRFGIISAAVRAGSSIERIGDAALVSRAIGGS